MFLFESITALLIIAGFAIQKHLSKQKRLLQWEKFQPDQFQLFAKRRYPKLAPKDASKIISRTVTTAGAICSDDLRTELRWNVLLDSIAESKIEATIELSFQPIEETNRHPWKKTAWIRWNLSTLPDKQELLSVSTEFYANNVGLDNFRLVLKDITKLIDEQINAYIFSLACFSPKPDSVKELSIRNTRDFRSIQQKHEGSVSIPPRNYFGVNEEKTQSIIYEICNEGGFLSDAISPRHKLRWVGDCKKSLSRENEIDVKIKFTHYGKPYDEFTEELAMSWQIWKDQDSISLECKWSGAFQQSTGDLVRHLVEKIDQQMHLAGGADSKHSWLQNARRTPASGANSKTKRYWPSMQEYNEAVQNALTCFSDEELRNCCVELNALGLPRVMSGAFANVYKLSDGKRTYAVRCFINELKDEEIRYERTGRFICADDLIYTVDLNYLKRGISVKGEWFPIIKMEWVEGVTLYDYVETHLGDSDKLKSLRNHFSVMMHALRDAGIAHADLQHGNIIIKNDDFILVDYDGMFVPELSGFQSNEKGHPNYQHPRREAKHFGPYVDNFSAWVIDTALLCITIDPLLWTRYSDCEAMMFRRRDFEESSSSSLIADLISHENPEIRSRAELLLKFLDLNPEQIPYLE